MLRRVDRVVEPICALLILVIVAVLFVSVVFRYVLNRPLGWTEEVARFDLVWLTFLGAYVAFRRGAHMHIDLAVAKLSTNARRRLSVTVSLLMALVIAVLIREGVRYAGTFFGDPSPYLRFPIGLQYAALPVAGVLWLLALGALIRAALRGKAKDEPATADLRLDSE